MDLINRYVYAVTKGLPEKQREDIEKELRTLIEDMVEQCQGSESYEVKLKKVLLNLGDPDVLANNYRESKRYLIGPKNYDTYILILKIVFGAAFLGVSIAFVIESIFSTPENIVDVFIGYFASLFSAVTQGFAWVTLAFAIAERKGVNVMDKEPKKAVWSLSQLPVIPQKKAVITPAESIASILFSTLFLTIIYFAPQLFAVYIPKNTAGPMMIPIFDIDILRGYRFLLIIIYIFIVAKEVLKLIAGRWTLRVSVLFSALSIVGAIFTLILFSTPGIWNQNFSADVIKYTNFNFDFNYIGEKLAVGVIIVIIVTCILEISTALYKGVKYNITK
jgi:hypothetical protein